MNATPLVLLHGYPFDHSMWEKVIAALDAEATILAPDLRGFGGTPLGPDEPALDLMADDVVHRLDRESIPQAVVAGFSMGGYVALSLAERYPDRLAGLALINSQARADTEEARTGRRAMIEKVRREGPSAAVNAALPKLFATAQVREEFKRFPREGAEQAGVAGITWALEAMARRPDRSFVLTRLAVPLLIVHSTEDQFMPVDRARDLARQHPHALYVEIAGAGHGTPLEDPARVAQGLSELLKRVDAAA